MDCGLREVSATDVDWLDRHLHTLAQTA